jgi:hypothetical protein
VSAVALHCPLHCCSSCAAQAFSQFAGAHWVVQSLCIVTIVHCALAVTSMFPHAEMSARAVRALAASAANTAKVAAAVAEWRAQACVEVFIVGSDCNQRTKTDSLLNMRVFVVAAPDRRPRGGICATLRGVGEAQSRGVPPSCATSRIRPGVAWHLSHPVGRTRERHGVVQDWRMEPLSWDSLP